MTGTRRINSDPSDGTNKRSTAMNSEDKQNPSAGNGSEELTTPASGQELDEKTTERIYGGATGTTLQRTDHHT
jgi:hypothetical protein